MVFEIRELRLCRQSMCGAHWNNKLRSNDIPRGVRLSFAQRISHFLLKLYMRNSSGGATKGTKFQK